MILVPHILKEIAADDQVARGYCTACPPSSKSKQVKASGKKQKAKAAKAKTNPAKHGRKGSDAKGPKKGPKETDVEIERGF